MKEHYYSNFKGCLGTRTHLDSLDGSLASILAPPLNFDPPSLSLSLFLSSSPSLSSSHVTLSVVRGCPSEPFKFRTRLLLSRCHFISWTTWTKIHGRKYPPPSSLHNTPPDIANYFAFISSFSLSLFFLRSKV